MPPIRVTAVIPCYNHGRFVGEAVRSCLGQEGADVRVVVVDDGSDDGRTEAACRALEGERVRVIRQDNRGLPAARNRGAAEAQGEFLVFLDADDWIEPGFVRKLHAALGADGGADASHAYCQERLVELGKGVWRVPEWDPVLLLITNLHPVTALVRRECFEAVGGFDESMRGGYEDWDFWLKFAERRWRGVRVREPLFVWRRHSDATMVMQVIHNHEELYRRIIANHRGLFDEHREEVLVRTNGLLRRFDANWLDETGYPIPLQVLWKVRDEYESMTAVRMHHAIWRAVGALPRPLRAAAGRALAVGRRLAPGRRRLLPEDLPPERLHSV